jgi:hypothetical protein
MACFLESTEELLDFREVTTELSWVQPTPPHVSWAGMQGAGSSIMRSDAVLTTLLCYVHNPGGPLPEPCILSPHLLLGDRQGRFWILLRAEGLSPC